MQHLWCERSLSPLLAVRAWKQKIFNLTTLFIIMTTYSAITDDEVVKLMIFCFDNFVIIGGPVSFCNEDLQCHLSMTIKKSCQIVNLSFKWDWGHPLSIERSYQYRNSHCACKKINAIGFCTLIVVPHWGRVTHICISKLTITGSDNGLSSIRQQAIIKTNASLLLIGTLGTNFSEIPIEI